MIVGYVVEDTAQLAFLEGLAQRTGWCPFARLEEGGFRGKGQRVYRRQVKRVCLELSDKKGADVIVFLRDANKEAWREAKDKERQMIPSEYQHKIIYGVAERNIECWLAADREYLAQQLDIDPAELDVDDPSSIIKSRLGADKFSQIVALVQVAPLGNWIQNSESFESFYDDVRDLSQRLQHLGCDIPNERERT
jgi:hypothetical protein